MSPKLSRIPNFYRAPLGLPLNWRDDVTGQLPAAVTAYLNNRIDGKPITDGQVALVCEYMVHHINAPCWLANTIDEEADAMQLEAITELRREAAAAKTVEDIAAYIHHALDWGLDPL